VAKCLKGLECILLTMLEGFSMYTHYGRVGAIPT